MQIKATSWIHWVISSALVFTMGSGCDGSSEGKNQGSGGKISSLGGSTSHTGGSATGGVANVGGTQKPASGGMSTSGGMTTSGGTPVAGGTTGKGGTTQTGTGGNASTGGLANGGKPAAGGIPATDGSAMGGSTAGGSTTDGSVPGGATVDMNKLRVMATTDLGGTDSDDEQSMVHFLVYSDHWDVEGLIASPWGAGRKEHILKIIDIYEKDYPKLKTHGNYPTPEHLRSVTKEGAIEKAGTEGHDGPTDGSKLIIEAAKRDDPRPLWITVWGAIDDVAQALHDAPEITAKLRVYWIAGPNRKHSPNSSPYLAKNHKDLWIIEADETYRGFFNGGDMSGSYSNTSFPKANVQGHGALGDFFMSHRADIKMGDTPAVLYTIDNAIKNPDDPTKPGWGGAFIPCGGDRPKCWKDDPSQTSDGYSGAKTVNVHRKAFLDDWAKMMDRAQAAK